MPTTNPHFLKGNAKLKGGYLDDLIIGESTASRANFTGLVANTNIKVLKTTKDGSNNSFLNKGVLYLDSTGNIAQTTGIVVNSNSQLESLSVKLGHSTSGASASNIGSIDNTIIGQETARDAYFSTTQIQDLVITGNLTVSGDITYLNVGTVSTDDTVIVLGGNISSAPTSDYGLIFNRGTSATGNVGIIWDQLSSNELKTIYTTQTGIYGNIEPDNTKGKSGYTPLHVGDFITEGNISLNEAHTRIIHSGPGTFHISSASNKINLQNININNGALSGISTITASSTITVASGGVTVSAGGMDLKGGLNLNNSGITNSGSIGGVVNLTSTGQFDLSHALAANPNDATGSVKIGGGVVVGSGLNNGDIGFSVGTDIKQINAVIAGKLGIKTSTSTPTYDLQVNGTAGFNEYLYHNGDTDTFIRFQNNQINLQAGSGSYIELTNTEFTVNKKTTINGRLTATDVQILASGNLTVMGNAHIESTLNVDGIVTLNNSLNLNGQTITNSGTLTLPTSTDTIVGRSTTDTLTNKTIDGSSNTLQNIADTSLSQITTGSKVAGSAVQLAGTSAIENSTGLRLKSSVGGTGLTLTSQVLNIDAEQSGITSLGTLTNLNINGSLGIGTESPSADLEVAGIGKKIKGNIFVPGAGNITVMGNAHIEKTIIIKDKLGIGIDSPLQSLHINGTDGIVIPSGTTAQRQSTTGSIRYNTTTQQFEGYSSSTWGSLGGVTDVDQDTKVIAETSAGADNDQLQFYTNGSINMIIDSNGRVGIGTETPNTDLDVAGLGSKIKGNILVPQGGNLTVMGNAHIESTLNVAGIVTLNNSLNLNGQTITNSGTLTLPTSTDTIVGRSTTDTLTNKTIDGSSNTLQNIADTSLSQITTGSKVAGSAVQLAGTSAIENSTGLRLKSSIGGTGLTLTSQVLNIDAAQSGITSLGTLTGLTVSGTATFQNDITVEGNLNIAGNIVVINETTTSSERLIVTNDGVGSAVEINQKGSGLIADFKQNNNSLVTISNNGLLSLPDILISGTDGYINMNSTSGSGGYGFRNNSGTLQFKNDGGTWTNMGSGTPGGDNAQIQFNNNDTSFSGASQFYYINSTNRVGLGTQNPTADLEVAGIGKKIKGNIFIPGTGNITVMGNAHIEKTIIIKDKLGIGIDSPLQSLHINGTDGIVIPSGTTAQRQSTTGSIRYNTTTQQFEGYSNSTWGSLGGVADVDQDTKVVAETSAGADNDQLQFYTNGSINMTIDSNGRVGIGTETPDADLDVAGLGYKIKGNILVPQGGNLTVMGNAHIESTLNVANTITAPDVIISGTDGYINMNSTSGSGGYGFRNNSGNMEFKNSGGSWTTFASSSGIISSVSNGVDNRIATFSGSDSLNGEGNLTFNGDLLGITGNIYLSGNHAYFNFSSTHGTLGYGIRNNCGTLQFKHEGGSWKDFETDTVSLYGDSIKDATGATKVQVEESTSENKIRFDTNNVERMIIDNNGNVGIGTTTPLHSLHISATDGLVLPVGTTAQRVATEGTIRYNTTTQQFEGYSNSSWGSLGGVADVDQDTKVVAETSAGADNDQLQFYTGGSINMIVDSNGRVGIGTETPDADLDVAGLGYKIKGNVLVPQGGNLTVMGNAHIESTLNVANTITSPDVIISGTDGYINMNSTSGSGGYGFRNNAGNMEFKNSGGSWQEISSGGSTTTIGVPSGNTYTTIENAAVGLTSTTTIANAFAQLDNWLLRYLVDTPPEMNGHSFVLATDQITLNWNLPPRQELGFVDISVPHINQVYIDFTTGNNWPGTTISTGSATTNRLNLYIEGSGSGLSGNTYNYYTITSETNYDFRIYSKNYNGRDPIKYHYIYNKSTLPIGPPGTPTSLTVGGTSTTTIALSWTKPADHDTNTAGIQTTPYIKQYSIRYNAVENRSALSTYDSHSGSQTTTATTSSNSSTSKTMSSLYPGHRYEFYIKALNTQNASFGSETSTPVLGYTDDPSAPTAISSGDASSLSGATAYSTAKQLNGSSLSPNGTVYKANSVTAWSPLVTSSTGTRKQNYVISPVTSGNITVGNLFAFGGNVNGANYHAKLILPGFGNDVANGTGNTSAGVKLVVDTEGDHYSGTSIGFWKSFTAHAEANTPNTYYPPQFGSYFLHLRYEADTGDSANTSVNYFYVDDLNSNPAIVSNSNFISSISTPALEYVSGIATVTTSTIFDVQFSMTNICHRFLPNNLTHAEIQMEDSSGSRRSSITSIVKGSGGTQIGGGNHFYYDVGGSAYSQGSKHNTDGTELNFSNHSSPDNIQFRDYQLQLNYNSTSLFNENIKFDVKAYNLVGNSGWAGGQGAKSTVNGNSLGSIRIDTVSTSLKSTISGIGTHVKSSTGTYPSGTLDTSYDHTVNIATDGSNSELQMVNGLLQTPTSGSSDGYKDYSGFYYGGVTSLDYSSIAVGGGSYTATDYRYFTMKITNVLDDTTKFRIIIHGSSNFSAYNDSDHTLIAKITNTGSSDTSNWLDCAAARNVAQDLDYSSSDGITVASVSGDGVSTGTTRYCFCPQVTGGGSVIYVRIGLRNNSNKKFTHISVSNGW